MKITKTYQERRFPAFDPWEQADETYDIVRANGSISASGISLRSALANEKMPDHDGTIPDTQIIRGASRRPTLPSIVSASNDGIVIVMEHTKEYLRNSPFQESPFLTPSENISEFMNLVRYAHISGATPNYSIHTRELGNAEWLYTRQGKDITLVNLMRKAFVRLHAISHISVRIRSSEIYSAREIIAATAELERILNNMRTRNRNRLMIPDARKSATGEQ